MSGCAACSGPNGCCGSHLVPQARADADLDESDSLSTVVQPSSESGIRLIDGMRSGDSAIDGPGLAGYWYTYSDQTGSLAPAPGASQYSPVVYEGRAARELKGSGQNQWGAGFGLDLNDAVPPHAPPGTRGVQSAYDASEYTGIRFDAASKTGPIEVVVELSDVDTNPHGGGCNPQSSRPAASCYGDYGYTVTVPGGGWHTVTVPFASLVLPEWTELAAAKHGFRRDQIYSVHFKIPTTSRPGAALPPFDVLVSNVYFVKARTAQ